MNLLRVNRWCKRGRKKIIQRLVEWEFFEEEESIIYARNNGLKIPLVLEKTWADDIRSLTIDLFEKSLGELSGEDQSVGVRGFYSEKMAELWKHLVTVWIGRSDDGWRVEKDLVLDSDLAFSWNTWFAYFRGEELELGRWRREEELVWESSEKMYTSDREGALKQAYVVGAVMMMMEMCDVAYEASVNGFWQADLMR